jgi:hypothetical protein
MRFFEAQNLAPRHGLTCDSSLLVLSFENHCWMCLYFGLVTSRQKQFVNHKNHLHHQQRQTWWRRRRVFELLLRGYRRDLQQSVHNRNPRLRQEDVGMLSANENQLDEQRPGRLENTCTSL